MTHVRTLRRRPRRAAAGAAPVRGRPSEGPAVDHDRARRRRRLRPVRLRFRAFQQLAVSVYARGATGPATTPPGGDRAVDLGGGRRPHRRPRRRRLRRSLAELAVPRRHRRGRRTAAPGRSSRSATRSPTGSRARSRAPRARATPGGPTSWPGAWSARPAGALGRQRGDQRQPRPPGRAAEQPRDLRAQRPVAARRRRARVPGVTDAILLEGINDLGQTPPATAAQIIAGLQQVVTRLQVAGVRVHLGTLTPSGGYGAPTYGSPAADAIRRTVNRWVRRSRLPDTRGRLRRRGPRPVPARSPPPGLRQRRPPAPQRPRLPRHGPRRALERAARSALRVTERPGRAR